MLISSSPVFNGQEALDFLTLKMVPISCPETPVKDDHSTLRVIPKERRSHHHHDESLKSRMFNASFVTISEVRTVVMLVLPQEGDKISVLMALLFTQTFMIDSDVITGGGGFQV